MVGYRFRARALAMNTRRGSEPLLIRHGIRNHAGLIPFVQPSINGAPTPLELEAHPDESIHAQPYPFDHRTTFDIDVAVIA
ncbi:MAG: hypothetical protein IPP82_17790 [Xanthomonadales bacterium]|nr:hypothetical protein [Xanthomonadales bacterium]